MMRSRGTNSDLVSILNELEGLLARSDHPPDLRPPLRTEELAALAERLPFPLPEDVRTVYEWKDGENGPPGFVEEFILCPFENVVEWALFTPKPTRPLAEKLRELNFDPDRLYPPNWLPILTNGGGDWLYVDAAEGAGSPVLLWRVYDGIWDLPVYDSLAAFFKTVLEGHRAGVFTVTEAGAQLRQEDGTYRQEEWFALEVSDENNWTQIRRRLNPLTCRE